MVDNHHEPCAARPARSTQGACKRLKGKLLVVAALVALTACLAGLAACGPQEQKAEGQKEAPTGSSQASLVPADSKVPAGIGNFTDPDSGSLPESFFTSDFVNAGNRGCNACHADVWDAICDLSPIPHLATSKPGYGKVANITDCYPCHAGGAALGGPILSDLIHSAHYSKAQFVEEESGNCWSCHAIDNAGNLVQWDVYKHTDQLGGFTQSGSTAVQFWLQMRKWEPSSTAGVSIAPDMQVDVSFDQEPTTEEDFFVASNYAVPEVDAATWALQVTGLTEEKSFTLEDLKALPQTKKTIAFPCAANAIGSYQIGNVPATGVLLSDLVEACGGAKEGVVAVGPNAADGWRFPSPEMNYNLDYLISQGAMVALQYWDHDLTVDQGSPATLVVPGTGAGWWSKWLTGLDFNDSQMQVSIAIMQAPVEQQTHEMGLMTPGLVSLNTGWLAPSKDGETLSGSTVELEGYAYAWTDGTTNKLERIAFSADYGETWTMVDVPDELDPFGLVHWKAAWTPPAPGTYNLRTCAIDTVGNWQYYPSNVILTVSE